MPTIYPLSFTCRFINVRLYGITQLGLRFYPVGSSAPETVTMTFQLYGSDQPVCSTAQLQPVSPSAMNLLLRQWQDHPFFTTGIPIQPFQVDITIFTDPSIHMGDPYGGFREHGPIQTASFTSTVATPEVATLVFELWGLPMVDMFGTVHNTKLPWYMSPVPEPQALAVDALS